MMLKEKAIQWEIDVAEVSRETSVLISRVFSRMLLANCSDESLSIAMDDGWARFVWTNRPHHATYTIPFERDRLSLPLDYIITWWPLNSIEMKGQGNRRMFYTIRRTLVALNSSQRLILFGLENNNKLGIEGGGSKDKQNIPIVCLTKVYI